MRIEKVAILDEVTARIKDSDYCFIINHGGVDVVQMGGLRNALRGCGYRQRTHPARRFGDGRGLA